MRKVEYEKSIAYLYPELAKQWHPTKNGELKPENFLPGSDFKCWWIDEYGHEWETRISHRTNGVGCPYCSNSRALAGFNDLESQFPNIAKEWNFDKNKPLLPSQVVAKTEKKVWWRCRFGHEWYAGIYGRTKGAGCYVCSGREPLIGINDFATMYPNLLKEWNYNKNKKLPNTYTKCSGRKVWWICSNGHEWQAAISDRTNGNGCPVCSGKQVLAGYNDLKTLYPVISKEWNYEKNDSLKPDSVTAGSDKIIWWKCSEGHEWQTSIVNRTKEQGTGCPVCSGHKVQVGYNDIFTTHPEILKMWDYDRNLSISPEDLTAGSSKKVWWKCDKGHSWKTSVANRTKEQGTGCPVCSGHKVQVGYNDLNTTHKMIARQWHHGKNNNLLPTQFSAGSSKKVWWKCDKGHEWEAIINSRALHNAGCPYCNSMTSFAEQAVYYYLKRDVKGTVYNRYQVKLAGKSYEADIFIPNLNVAIEYDGMFWHKFSSERDLKKNKAFETLGITLIRVQEGNCNKIENKKIIHDVKVDNYKNLSWAISELENALGVRNTVINVEEDYMLIFEAFRLNEIENSLANKYPEVADEWNFDKNGDLNPSSFSSHSDIKVWWKCSRGHEWRANISSRTGTYKTNCPICSNREVLVGYNDLATTHNELASEWNYELNGDLTPFMFTGGSSKKVWWMCKFGHTWQSRIVTRVRGYGCPICSNQQVLPGYNDLLTLCPEIAREWNYNKNYPLRPENITKGYDKKIWWVCNLGHEWESLVYSRTGKNKTGCPICSGRKIKVGFNDLTTTNPELVEEWNYDKNFPLKPQDVTNGSAKKVWWRCPRGHEWQTRIAHRANGIKCPVCSNRQVAIGYNDLSTTDSQIAEEWNYDKNIGIGPNTVHRGSHKKVWWKCSNGHEWQAVVRQRCLRGSTCPICKRNN